MSDSHFQYRYYQNQFENDYDQENIIVNRSCGISLILAKDRFCMALDR